MLSENTNVGISLHKAACKGHTEIVKALLNRKGIEVNAVDKNGYTPLDYASCRGHQGVIDALLAAGAKKPGTQMDKTQIAQEGASKRV